MIGDLINKVKLKLTSLNTERLCLKLRPIKLQMQLVELKDHRVLWKPTI